MITQGSYEGKPGLVLPEATFIIDNPEAVSNHFIGTPYLARYNPQDQFCTVLTDKDLDKLEEDYGC